MFSSINYAVETEYPYAEERTENLSLTLYKNQLEINQRPKCQTWNYKTIRKTQENPSGHWYNNGDILANILNLR